MKRKLRVAIVGGGLGGLTACLAFARRGIEAHVFEQANGLKEIGAGVGLSANAVRVLRELGLECSSRCTAPTSLPWESAATASGSDLLLWARHPDHI